MKNQMAALSAKHERFDRFRTAAERDQWLQNQVVELQASHDQVSKQQALLAKSLGRNKNEAATLEADIKTLEEQIESRREEIGEIEETFQAARVKKDSLEARKKNLWRDEAKLQAQLDSFKEKAEKTRRLLFSTMDRATSKGHASVANIVERMKLKGYYGPLFDLFTVSDALQTATETIGSGSLFHLVVDTDETASKILKELGKEGGRVTFMPLNRLNPKPVTYPDSEKAIPLISKLVYNPRYQKAMEQVFGKAVVCPNLETAAMFATSHKLTAVSFSGDRVDRKGALSGGYHDQRTSRLLAARSMIEARDKMNEAFHEIKGIKTELAKIESELLAARDALTEIDGRRRFIISNRPVIIREIEDKTAKLRGLEDLCFQIERQVNSLGDVLRNLDGEIQSTHDEIGTPLLKKLGPEESRLLQSLPGQIQECEAGVTELVVRRTDIEAAKNQIEFSISSNLRRRLVDLESRLEGLNEVHDEDLGTKSEELKNIEASLTGLNTALDEFTDQCDEYKDIIAELKARLDRAKTEQGTESLAAEKQQRLVDRFLTKKALLMQKRETAVSNIRELGVLPEEAFEKYSDADQTNILKLLHSVHETLKKYEHVNKKAYEQYGNFTKQRETLEERKEELDESAKSIETLIATLDQRKNEAIEQTFDQVAKYFSQVWKKLVPDGEGELLIVERDDDSVFIINQEITQNTQEEVERYIGVSLNVCFTPGQKMRMSQLSGGQKSLVALTLIFAIQKCDPAPFYLFDEIDAALDTQYRTAVAGKSY